MKSKIKIVKRAEREKREKEKDENRDGEKEEIVKWNVEETLHTIRQREREQLKIFLQT